MDNTLKNLILENDIISFDMFDTLVTRIIDDPENVFSILEKEFNIPSFRALRHDKQSELGLKLFNEKGYPHANLDEIYEYIRETTSIKNTNIIKKREIEIEKDLLFQNPQMYEVYKFAKDNNKKVIVTSDMYIEFDDIKDILNNCGYTKIDKIYLSSKEKKAKFNGELFDLVIEENKDKKILHIGDNEKDDVIIPSEKGINVYHYKQSLINKSKNLVLSFHNGIVRLIKLSSNNFFEGIGVKAGLLYYGLYKKILEYKTDNIYFLSRDGYNMYNLLKKYNKNRKLTYIYASRRSMLLASIDSINDETINILPPFTFGQTIDEILEYISIKNVITEEDIKKIGFDNLDDKIKDINDMEKFKKIYYLKEKEILNCFSKERKDAKKYFDSINFSTDSLFFDCGWNGSSQYLLENLLDKLDIKTNIKFIYNGIFDNEKSRRQLANKNFDTYLFGFDDKKLSSKTLIDNIIMMELFFSAPHNSVLKYDDKKIYILEELESDFKYKEDIYNGLEKYFKYVSYYEKYNIEITPSEAIEPLINFIKNPTIEEAINIGNISCVDGFANQKGETKYIAKVTEEQLKNNPNIEVYWQFGLLKRDDVSESVKKYIKERFNIVEKKIIVSNKKNYINRIKNSIRVNGIKTTLYKLNKKIINKIKSEDDYQLWIKLNEKNILIAEKLEYNPKFSIVMPVYNAIKQELIDAIESVLNQTYQNFEICIVDDASTSEETKKILKSYENKEKIKISYHKENGHISKTTNDGIKLATGEFICLLDNDDVLAPNALYEVAKLLNKNKKLDFIYSDEDKLTKDGKYRHNPFFKPDWSPDTFMSLMYTNHFSIFRKTIVEEIGGEKVGLEGAQDYDFVMRFTERTNNIGHISKILYHWREREGSIANDPEAKPYALTAIEKLKQDVFKRKKINANIEFNKQVYQYRVNYIPKKKSVTVIIYGKDKSINGLNNNYVKEIKYINNLNDYKKIKNEIKTELLLFINSNIAIKTNNFVELLCGHASLDHIGLVGCKYINNGKIVNSGLTTYMNNNNLETFDDNIPQYYCRNILDYNCYSVSTNLFAIKTELFNKFNNYISDNIFFAKKNIRKRTL